MISKKKRLPNKGQKGNPPKKPATVIRIFRAFERQYRRYCCNHEKAESDHQTSERMVALWTRKVGIWTIVMGAMAVISAFIYVMQYRAMITANEQSRVAFTSSERAFLFVSDLETVPMINDAGQQVFRIFPKWTNSGDTPTKNLQISVFCGNDASNLDYRAPKHILLDIFGPKQIKGLGNCDYVPTATEMKGKGNYIYSLAVGAKAVYYDVFDRPNKHVSEFCAFVHVRKFYNPGDVAATLNTEISYCPTHNCADEECPEEDR